MPLANLSCEWLAYMKRATRKLGGGRIISCGTHISKRPQGHEGIQNTYTSERQLAPKECSAKATLLSVLTAPVGNFFGKLAVARGGIRWTTAVVLVRPRKTKRRMEEVWWGR